MDKLQTIKTVSVVAFMAAIGATKLVPGKYTNPKTSKEVKAVYADSVPVAFIASNFDPSKDRQMSLVSNGESQFWLLNNALGFEVIADFEL